MKRNIRIEWKLAITLVAILLLIFTAAQAEDGLDATTDAASSTVLTIQSAYEVTGDKTMVYHDGAFTMPWGTLPRGTVVRVDRLSSGFVTVKVRGRIGYIADTATRPLKYGDRMYATRNTRVYRRPTTKSKYIEVPSGTDVIFEAMSGDCVQVKRNGVVGYMTIKHLGFLADADEV